MSAIVQIAAVGDILIPESIIRSSRRGASEYSFAPVFRYVAPLLRQADLTIGNLEVPLVDAGGHERFTYRHPKTGFYSFHAPGQLARDLQEAGFDVLVTGNNHCLDRGTEGLIQTLDTLDHAGIAHTGTFRTKAEAGKPLLMEVQGIRIAVLSYSKSTNKLPLPADRAWMVNLLDEEQMLRELAEARQQADYTIVCPHFGREYTHVPVAVQRRLVRKLLQGGADLVLGSHPHVVQPVVRTPGGQAAAYSLGNFVSTTLMGHAATRHGLMLLATIKKDDSGVRLQRIDYVPTWVRRIRSAGRISYQVLPVPEIAVSSHLLPAKLKAGERRAMRLAAKRTLEIVRRPVQS
ncbi:poly-gamma-glutamate synthesis protein (capsule biosynthesis protein) [Paenibacillus sp. UNCCL117]|uniref:CapA family protein n=1 Tax=unclassified Paenibacillus TaxID=185978 RepID=UPI0008841FE1|nr:MULTISPECIES: CapA family protein [unclassified Paenibacillus]SDC17608.1 poly-gamma-glutamate synthesis protein (capsule biosynthesis protein) [Paenibacillus sp. cl123]SFW18042.1 poly-gamma-glutamate synthesis protein (capsule biosynthesis protein) [Paenibacillus sp. UNCCL117]